MKKLIATVLSTVMVSGSFAALAVDYGEEYENHPQQQTSQIFSDVPSTHWAFDYIGEMAQREVISGYPDGRFLPENQVTRAEFAKIMVCAAGMRVSNTNQTSFTDVYTSDWYCPYIEAAKEYLTGYSTASGMVYRPTTPALREDIAVALVKLKGYDTSVVDESILNMFSDSYSISDSAKKYVAVAVERGLISGYDDNTFRGQATITRAEAATMLWRAFQYGNDNKVTDSSENSNVQATNSPQATRIPEADSPSESTGEPEAAGKPYKVDTLKSVNLNYPTLHSTYDYEGEKIYYLYGTEVYELDPYTGDTRSIYDASGLTLPVTEMQEREVTKTITKTVPVENEESPEPAVQEDEPENGGSIEADSSVEADGEIGETDPAAEPEQEVEEDEQPQTQEITEEVTEIIQEEVVVKEYSAYIPEQIIYDKFNDRLILNGYFSRLEQPFKEASDKEEYRVAYDITNDEICIDFYVEFESEGLNGNVALQCFIAKDRIVLNYANPVLYNIESNTQTHLGYESSMRENRYFWTAGNDLYVYSYEDHGSGFNGFNIFQYDFSSGFEYITHIEATQMGVNGQYVYYSSNEGAGSNSSVKMHKLDMNTGNIEELNITTDDGRCTVMDMQPIRLYNEVFIPVSDEHFVFYDTAADAFRVLTKN